MNLLFANAWWSIVAFSLRFSSSCVSFVGRLIFMMATVPWWTDHRLSLPVLWSEAKRLDSFLSIWLWDLWKKLWCEERIFIFSSSSSSIVFHDERVQKEDRNEVFFVVPFLWCILARGTSLLRGRACYESAQIRVRSTAESARGFGVFIYFQVPIGRRSGETSRAACVRLACVRRQSRVLSCCRAASFWERRPCRLTLLASVSPFSPLLS